MNYNNKIDEEEQLDTEEWIAAHIFNDNEYGLSEQLVGDFGRSILLEVLSRFRPDLVEDN